MTEEQILQAKGEWLKKQEMRDYLEAMQETRSIYPGEQIDLDWVTDLEMANCVRHYARSGVRAECLRYFWDMETDLKLQGVRFFERMKAMNRAISRAPSHMFRAGFDRTKAG